MYELLFGRLNQDYCLYFYILMIFNFAVLVPCLLLFLLFILKNKITLFSFLNQLFLVFLAFLVYLQSRILYSMCHMH